MQCIMCVVVGDRASQKTCMLYTYTTNAFPGEYIPTVFENHSSNVMVDGHTVNLGLSDFTGDLSYLHFLRPECLPSTDVFLVCFAVDSPESFQNVKNEWIPQIKRYRDDIPFLLIGTKKDCRDDPKKIAKLQAEGQMPVTHAEGVALCEEMGGYKYLECSSLTQEGLKSVFDGAIRCLLEGRKGGKKKKCVIM